MTKQDNRKHFEISSGSISPLAFRINVAKQSFTRQPIQEVMHSEDGKTITPREFDENLRTLRTAIAQAESLLTGNSPSVENINKAQRCLSNALAVNLPWSVKDREIRASHSETVRQLYKTVRESSGMGGTSSIGIQSEIMQRQGVALAQVINSDVRQQAILRDFQTMDTEAVYEKYWGNEIKKDLAEIEHTNQMVQKISDMPDDTPEQRAEKARRWEALAEQEEKASTARKERTFRRTQELIAIQSKLSPEQRNTLAEWVERDVYKRILGNRNASATDAARYDGAKRFNQSRTAEAGYLLGSAMALGCLRESFWTRAANEMIDMFDGAENVSQQVDSDNAVQDVMDTVKSYCQGIYEALGQNIARQENETFEDYTRRCEEAIKSARTFLTDFRFPHADFFPSLYLHVRTAYEREARKEYGGDIERARAQTDRIFPDMESSWNSDEGFRWHIRQRDVLKEVVAPQMLSMGEMHLVGHGSVYRPVNAKFMNNNMMIVDKANISKITGTDSSLDLIKPETPLNITTNMSETEINIAQNNMLTSENTVDLSKPTVPFTLNDDILGHLSGTGTTLTNDVTVPALTDNSNTLLTLRGCGQQVLGSDVSTLENSTLAFNNNQVFEK